jgi:hypothetical protein
MKKNASKLKSLVFYSIVISVSLLGAILASNIYKYETIVRGVLGFTSLAFTVYYGIYTQRGGDIEVIFRPAVFVKRMVVLFVFAIVVSWSIQEVFNLVFYIIGV